jgi:hypothetical protein
MPTNETQGRETSPSTPVEPCEHAIQSGWGKCSKSGCNCNTFEGSAGTCGNSGCGHSFDDHW